MEVKGLVRINSIDDFDYKNKTVLLRVDINSPIDPVTKKIVNENRITASLPTIRDILAQEAKLAIIAHRRDGWRETTPAMVIECLEALRELTLAEA